MSLFKFILIPIITLSLSALADDEMQTETKPGAKPTEEKPSTVIKAPDSGPQPAVKKGAKPADPSLRARIRKKAPFWIEDAAHGAPIQINKDGTFTSEAQGGGSIAGTWKAVKGEMQIIWSDGGEQYSYSVSGGGALLIEGRSPKKGRYLLGR